MRVIPLQSGSAGNCVYVEARGVRLLIDAGLSAARTRARLGEHGVDLADIDAVLITHEHSDHIGAAGPLTRKEGLPLAMTIGTWIAARATIGNVGTVRDWAVQEEIDFGGGWAEPAAGEVRCFAAGTALEIGPVRIETLATPHDAADGVVYCVDDGVHRVGVCTDFGHVYPALRAFVASLDAVVMESNYDAAMLEFGPYPAHLKRRIAGPGGHISNVEAAELLATDGKRLRWACLAHLSETNNEPGVALAAHRAALGESFPLHLTRRYGASDPLVL